MSVEITSKDDDSVLLKLKRQDLYLLLAYLSHAKFGAEIKSYVLLSPLMNELIASILDYGDQTGLPDIGSGLWRRRITTEEASDPNCFVHEVQRVLTRDLGDEEVKKALTGALFPNELGAGVEAP